MSHETELAILPTPSPSPPITDPASLDLPTTEKGNKPTTHPKPIVLKRHSSSEKGGDDDVRIKVMDVKSTSDSSAPASNPRFLFGAGPKSPIVKGPRLLVRNKHNNGITSNNLMLISLPDYCLRPDQPLRLIWNAIRLLFIIFYALLCPLRLCLVNHHDWQPTIIIDYVVVDTFFILNLLCHLFIFVPSHLEEVHHRRQIAREYLSGRSSSLIQVIIDLIATAPIDLFGYIGLATSNDNYVVVYALRLLKLLHLFAVFDLAENLPTSWPSWDDLKFKRAQVALPTDSTTARRGLLGLESVIMSQHGNRVSDINTVIPHSPKSSPKHSNKDSSTESNGLTLSTLRNLGLKPVWKIIATYILLMHLYACLWALLTVTSRLNTHIGDPISPPERYMECLYFVVVTLGCVGYGDITPQNGNEVALTMLIELSGFLCIGGLIAYTVPLFAQAQAAETAYQDKFTAWAALFDENAIPTEVRDRILDYYRYLAKRQQGAPEEQLLADEHLVPTRYRNDICMHIFGRTLLTLPFLCVPVEVEDGEPPSNATVFGAPLGLVRGMIAHMHPSTYCAGDIILFCGQRNDSLYVIARGDVAVITLQETQEGEVVETSAQLKSKYFGLESFLHPEVLVQADYQVVDTTVTNPTPSPVAPPPGAMGAGVSQRRAPILKTPTSLPDHSHPFFQGSSHHSNYCDVFSLTRADYAQLARPYPGFTLDAIAEHDPNFDAEFYAAERAALEAKKAATFAALDEKAREKLRVNTFMGSNPLAAVGLEVQQELAKQGEFPAFLPSDSPKNANTGGTAPLPRASVSVVPKVLVAGQTAGHRRRRQSSNENTGHLKKALADREKLLAEVAEAAETDDSDDDNAPKPMMVGSSGSESTNESHSIKIPSPLLTPPPRASWIYSLFFDPATLIDYSSIFRRIWDMLLLALLLYTFIVVPIQAAFLNIQINLQQSDIPFSVIIENKFSKSSTSLIKYFCSDPPCLGVSRDRHLDAGEWIWLVFNWLVDLVFILDIFFRSRKFKSLQSAIRIDGSSLLDDLDDEQPKASPRRMKTQVQPKELQAPIEDPVAVQTKVAAQLTRSLIEQGRRIGQQYRKTWGFIADVTAAIPLEIIIEFGVSSQWLYFLRLNRLLRLHRFPHLIQRFESELLEHFSRGFSLLGQYLTMIKILFYAILFCHGIGCFWYLLSYMITWRGDDNNINNTSSWILADGLINEPLANRYVRSFFFALVTCATIGYGGIVPRCTGEYIFVIILIMLGVTMYVTLLASLTVSAENRHAATHASEQFLQILRQYFRTRNVDLKIREKCMQYYNAQGNALLKCRREDELMNVLPPLLKIELFAPLMAQAFLTLPLFSEFSDEFLDMLLSHLEARTYAPGDIISRVGERALETVFIHRGVIDVRVMIAGHMRTIRSLQAEESFGSECLLYDAPPERPASYTAQAICNVFVLSKAAFDAQLAVFPDDHDLMIAKRYHIQSLFDQNAPTTQQESRRDSLARALGAVANPSIPTIHHNGHHHRGAPSLVMEEASQFDASRVSGAGASDPKRGGGHSSSSDDSSDDDDGDQTNVRNSNVRQHSAIGTEVSMTRLFGGRRAYNFDTSQQSPGLQPISVNKGLSIGVSSNNGGGGGGHHARNSSHSTLLAGALQAIMKNKGLDGVPRGSSRSGNSDGSAPITPIDSGTPTTPMQHQPSAMPPPFTLTDLPPPPPDPPQIPVPPPINFMATDPLDAANLSRQSSVSNDGEAKDDSFEQADSVAPVTQISPGPPKFEKGQLRKLSVFRMERKGSVLIDKNETTPNTGKVVDQPKEVTPLAVDPHSPSFQTPEEAATKMEQDPVLILASPSIRQKSIGGTSTTGGTFTRVTTNFRSPSLNRGGGGSSMNSVERKNSLRKQPSVNRMTTFGKGSQAAPGGKGISEATPETILDNESAPSSPPSVNRTISFGKGQTSVAAASGGSLSRQSSFIGGSVPMNPVSPNGGLLRNGTLARTFVAEEPAPKLPRSISRQGTFRGDLAIEASGGQWVTNPASSPHSLVDDLNHDLNARLQRHQRGASRMGSFHTPSDAATAVKRVISRVQTSGDGKSVGGVHDPTSPGRTRSTMGRTRSAMGRTTTSNRTASSIGAARRFGTQPRVLNKSTFRVNGASRTLTKGLLRTESVAALTTEDGEEISLRMIPNSLFRNVWSFIGGLGLLWFAFVVPFRIAFEGPFRHSWSPVIAATQVNKDGTPGSHPLTQDSSSFLFSPTWSLHPTIYVDCIFDAFFLIDMVLHFNFFAYYENGLLVTHPPARIRKNYLRTTFLLDVAGTFIFDFLILSMNNEMGVWILYWLRILRLIRLHRLSHHVEVTYDFLENYCRFKNLSLINIMLQWVLIAIVFHWLACMWYLVGLSDNSAASWLSQRDAPVYGINTHDQPNLSQSYTYTTCLYFIVVTMSTVGYGDIQPHTVLETWFSVLTIFLGLVIYASVTANIASLAANFDVAIGSFQREFDNVKHFMMRKQLPNELKKKINTYYRGMWQEFKGKSEQEILHSLPLLIREDISYSLYGDLLANCGLFAGGPIAASPSGGLPLTPRGAAATAANESVFKLPFLRRLSSLLIYRSYADGELVFKKDEYIDYAILVKHGSLDAFEMKPMNLQQQQQLMNSAEEGTNQPLISHKESLVHRYTKNMVVNPDLLMVLTSNSKEKRKSGGSDKKSSIPKDSPTDGVLQAPVPVKQTRTVRAFQNVIGLILMARDLHELLLLYPPIQPVLRRNIVGMKSSKTGLVRQGNTLSMMAEAKRLALEKEKQEKAAALKAQRRLSQVIAASKPTAPLTTESEQASGNTHNGEENSADIANTQSLTVPDDGEVDLDDEDDEIKIKTTSWIIARDSQFRLIWDLFALAFVILYLISIPILVAFSSSALPWSHAFWTDLFWPILVLTYVFDIFFWFDFYLHMRRFGRSKEAMLEENIVTPKATDPVNPLSSIMGPSPTEKTGQDGPRLSPQDITRDYLFRRPYGLLFAGIECISGTPWDIGALIIAGATSSSFITLQFVALLRLGRLLYIARLGTYLESLDLYLEQAKLNLNFQLQRIMKLSVMILLVLHWMSCGWYLLGKYPYAGGAASDVHPDSGVTTGYGAGDPNVSWLTFGYKIDILLDADAWGHYLWSLYWAISTITTTGFGDITPTNQGEILLNMLMILGGDIVYGAIIGGICVNASNAHAPIAQYTSKIQSLMSYMRYRHTPQTVKNRILLYHAHIWSSTHGLDEHDQRVIQHDLPQQLSKECQYFIHAPLLKSVPFFHGCSTLFLSHIACILRERTFLTGESVYRQGDIGESLYILKSGEMRVGIRKQIGRPVLGYSALSSHDVKHIQLESPSIFGEVSFFMGTIRSAHVIAVNTCIVLELNRKEFEERLQYFPHYRKPIMERFVLNVYPDIKARLKNRAQHAAFNDPPAGGGGEGPNASPTDASRLGDREAQVSRAARQSKMREYDARPPKPGMNAEDDDDGGEDANDGDREDADDDLDGAFESRHQSISNAPNGSDLLGGGDQEDDDFIHESNNTRPPPSQPDPTMQRLGVALADELNQKITIQPIQSDGSTTTNQTLPNWPVILPDTSSTTIPATNLASAVPSVASVDAMKPLPTFTTEPLVVPSGAADPLPSPSMTSSSAQPASPSIVSTDLISPVPVTSIITTTSPKVKPKLTFIRSGAITQPIQPTSPIQPTTLTSDSTIVPSIDVANSSISTDINVAGAPESGRSSIEKLPAAAVVVAADAPSSSTSSSITIKPRTQIKFTVRGGSQGGAATRTSLTEPIATPTTNSSTTNQPI